METLGFTVTATQNKLSGGKVAYSAHTQHAEAIRGRRLNEELAQYLGTNPTLAGNFVNGLCGFIEDKLRQGYKLDFGSFRVTLSIRGGFSSVTDDYKAGRNSVGVTFSPGVGLQKAVAELQPENVTRVERPLLKSACVNREGAKMSVIVCGENCGANGTFPNADFRGEGDGVWLEDAEGSHVAAAKVLAQGRTRIDFVFEEPVPVGRYRLVVGFPCGEGPAIATSGLMVSVN